MQNQVKALTDPAGLFVDWLCRVDTLNPQINLTGLDFTLTTISRTPVSEKNPRQVNVLSAKEWQNHISHSRPDSVSEIEANRGFEALFRAAVNSRQIIDMKHFCHQRCLFAQGISCLQGGAPSGLAVNRIVLVSKFGEYA